MKRRAKTGLGISLIGFVIVMLLPTLADAGSLEPPALAVDGLGNPVGTMKTLDAIPPAWSQKLDSTDGTSQLWPGCDSSRFNCVMYERLGTGISVPQAVLDKETGLVWARNANIANGTKTWLEALAFCTMLEIAGRKGWRLPTVEELASLVDTSNEDPPLPTDHPFLNVQSSYYWSSSASASHTGDAWVVGMGLGGVNGYSKASYYYVWPVRGGQ